MSAEGREALREAMSLLASVSTEERAKLMAWLVDGGRPDDLPALSSGLQAAIAAALRALPSVRDPRHLLAALIAALPARPDATQRATKIELIWTGPTMTSAALRSTRQVVSEIVRDACQYVLVGGYQLRPVEGADAGLIDEFLSAARRGVRFTFVLNDDESNFGALSIERWPQASQPRVLTWYRRPDGFATLHAKVIVADDARALITSANLTLHGLSRNIEVGVLVDGDPALQLRRHFVALEREGILRAVTHVVPA